MALLLNTHKLAKSFAGKVLFQDVALGIEDGEKIGLVGPNGAGKSTLLKILAGQISADSGDVTRRKNLRFGYLEQTPTFPEGQTIIEALLSHCDDQDESLGAAYEWLAKMDLTRFGENFLVEDLSGGWKKRVALARELIREPDILILDEPTNHLDVSSILWLEEFLNQATFALLMVTHDRLFLQRVCNKIFDLDPRNPNYLLSVRGDYLMYVEAKEQLISGQEQRERVLKNTLRRETEWLRRGAKARQTKQKARIGAAHDLKDDVTDLTAKNANRQVNLNFKETERTPQKLMEVKDLSKSYSGRNLFDKFNYTITPKTRLALLGDNGSGKSTLIRMLLGQEPPDKGTVYLADKMQVAYFEQNRETLKPELSVLKNICPEGDYVHFQGSYVFNRSYLERFLFNRQQMDLPVSKMSGGEQSRLRLAQLMLKEAQILILDEPTNDLDTQTLDVLEEALKSFNGAVILVTHDRYFLDQVATDILAFDPQPDGTNNLLNFTGYMQWENWFEEKKEQEQNQRKAAATAVKVAESKKKKLSFKEKFEYENMEAEILKLEEKLSKLQIESSLPEVVSNSAKVQEVYKGLSETQGKLDLMYARWSELEERAKADS